MKRIFFAIGLLVVILYSVSMVAQITVGVVLSTTGPGASHGIPQKNVMSAYAATTIAGHNVRYVVYDDQSDSTVALQTVKRLISEEKVDIILGPSLTTSVLGVIDTIAEFKTPIITFASATRAVAPVDARRRWVFKTPANDDIYDGALVRHMTSKGVKTAAIIAADDPYGESHTEEFKKLAEAAGIKLLRVEKYDIRDTSVVSQVLRVMKDNPDAVYIIAIGTPSVLPEATLVQRGYRGKIYQTGSVVNGDFPRLGGKLVEGTLVPTSPEVAAEDLPDDYPTKSEALRFVKAYESKFGPRSKSAASIWDALIILQAAVPKAVRVAKPGTVEFREALRTSIEHIQGLKGACGIYRFSSTEHSGVGMDSMAVLRVKNGGWRIDSLLWK